MRIAGSLGLPLNPLGLEESSHLLLRGADIKPPGLTPVVNAFWIRRSLTSFTRSKIFFCCNLSAEISSARKSSDFLMSSTSSAAMVFFGPMNSCCVCLAGCVAMATKHNPDPNNPTSKEGKCMALELKHEHMLDEAKKAAEERKRARSVGDTLQSPKRGCVGRGKPRGRRGGRRQGSATVTSPRLRASSHPVWRFCVLNLQHNTNLLKFPILFTEKNMERLSDILSSCPPPEPQKSSASSWSFRQQKASERWKEARPHHLQCLLKKRLLVIPYVASATSRLLLDCDVLHHKKQPLHNRDSLMNGFFKPISPTTCVVRVEGGYDTHDQACILPTVKAPNCSCKGTNFTVVPGKPVILITINGCYDLHLPLYVCQTCQQQWTPDLKVLLKSGYWPASVSISTLYTLDLLSSFEDLKVISPGFSRQAFAKLLEHRTKCGGRSGPVNGDALQRSFLEFSYASDEEDQLCCGAPFVCPACTPEMLAVSADGKRKLYRFRRSGSSDDSAFFNGLFVAEDSVAHGDSQWTAARETSRRASKLDEEGMEVAVCRHGFLLKALNMYRGEIFAYPLYLQKELMPAKAKFFAMDVAELTTMKPFLSVMHARAHATKCEIKWSGKNQEGAGMTAGEEVEQVNSYLSRCALTTKYMSKAGEWKTSKRLLEETASLEELKTELHCVSDDMVSTWISDVKEWASAASSAIDFEGSLQTKKRLNQEMLKYNQLVRLCQRHRCCCGEHSLSGGSIMSARPWEVHGMAKKKILDQVMLTRRLQEEKGILLLEMAQHCTWLQNMAVALKNKVAEEDVDKGNGGLGCTLRRKHSEASERLQVVLQQYKTALGPDASFLQHEEESQSGLSSPDTNCCCSQARISARIFCAIRNLLT
ncbi:hypothetical protein F7725_009421 [Dissostichus mawsoni]|uniref:CxC3 like cysteine cluster domain-containing protein n=1 Tax=Dissostichus mawsoni TaxID=36200 RepID=A0A7J5XLD0_DISMA|nr:hypothetical protein F7725_009421 [Dissostichus mawsoni]